MKIHYSNNRSAYTIIELVFIIVIIGILAAVAIPKLAATRNDARLASDLSNMSQCIYDAASNYIATNSDMTAGDSKACAAVECYTIDYGSGGLNFIVTTNPSAKDFCSRVDEIGAHLAKTYNFRGTSVSY